MYAWVSLFYMWSSALCFCPTGLTCFFFFSHLSDLSVIIVMHKNNNKKEAWKCRMKLHFSKINCICIICKRSWEWALPEVWIKILILINIVTEILLSFGCCMSHLASRKKTHMSLSLLFFQSSFFFLCFFFISRLYISLHYSLSFFFF